MPTLLILVGGVCYGEGLYYFGLHPWRTPWRFALGWLVWTGLVLAVSWRFPLL
jgi:hypothetical protein